MQRLLELIEAISTPHIDTRTLHLSAPRPSDYKANTIVTVQGKLTSGTYLYRLFRYNRFDLDSIRKRVLVWNNQVDTLGLLAEINKTPLVTYSLDKNGELNYRHGYLLEQDIVNETFSVNPGQTLELKITANPSSYLFKGSLSVQIVRA